jgi:hypothetical protein
MSQVNEVVDHLSESSDQLVQVRTRLVKSFNSETLKDCILKMSM